MKKKIESLAENLFSTLFVKTNWPFGLRSFAS